MAIRETFEAGLLRVLIQLSYINPEDALKLDVLYRESEIDIFEDFLLSEGIVDEEQLLEALSQFYQIPSFDVIGYFFEYHLLHMFPKDLLLRNEMIPLEVDENMMIMIVSRPDNPDLLALIGEHVSYDIRFFVGIGGDIIDSVEEFYDKADTEDSQDEDLNEEHMLFGEFEMEIVEEPEESTVVFEEEEDIE